MDKDEKQAFSRWLNTANENELQTTLVKLQALESQLTEESAIADLKYLKRKVLEEIEAHRQINNVKLQ